MDVVLKHQHQDQLLNPTVPVMSSMTVLDLVYKSVQHYRPGPQISTVLLVMTVVVVAMILMPINVVGPPVRAGIAPSVVK